MDMHASKSEQQRIKYFAAGSGIPEVKTILSGFVIRGFLGIQTLWVKVVSLTLAVAAGLSIGRQGPLVHIACCVGNVACRLFKKYNKNEGKRREILSASAAAGVAVAFGAPIGGVLFSLEEVSYYFPSKTMWRSFFCALTAAFTLKVINPWQTGKMVLFQVTYDRDWHNYDLIVFVLLGLCGGLYGGLFIRMFKAWMKSKPHSLISSNPVREVGLVALVTALLSWGNKFTRLDSTGFVGDLFSECMPEDNLGGLCARTDYEYYHVAKLLLIAMFTKMVTTVITVGAKIPAGVFIPHMIFGAAFGRVVGMTLQHFYRTYPGMPFFSSCMAGDSCIMPGVYAMVGAAATVTGVTRMTLSMSVIMFELTGSLTYMIPVMIAVMISKWTADAVHRASFFEVMVERNGHPYLDNKKDYIRVGSTAEVMERGFEVIDVDHPNTVAELTDKLDRLVRNGYPDGGFPIVERDVPIGYIAVPELHHALSKVKHKGGHVRCYFKRIGGGTGTNGQVQDKLNDFTAYMDRAPLSVSQSASMELVMEMFAKLGVRYLCVVRHGRYVGMIHKKRLLAYIHQLEEEEQL
ncbi:chloride channel [Syncephalis pseudoplumigaleata]|uniref:Chloride channel protein n=1 Tax=Syncephalis pseudoplumigaleata TaxID=1712513 RepID=A0A4P9Z3Q5_9FUNG|nr:chloride channel [Syncephalis pseudoplumigaleata]|eukprot:RKP26431.1 chloride channel [Syncephalis pseudoplumigaleata]